MDRLEDILKFEMTMEEAIAFKICLLWEECCEKELGDRYKFTRLRKTGDPRKSNLFKYAWKLYHETKGLLEENEIRFYIIAQLQIMQMIKSGDIHALIVPQIIVGDKAWRRWKMWKKKYEKKMAEVETSNFAKLTESEEKIEKEIDRTKKFLVKQLGDTWDVSEIKRLLGDRTLIRWITMNKVSPFYGLMSPFITEALDGKTLEQVFVFDLSLHKNSITSKSREYFREIFSLEYPTIP